MSEFQTKLKESLTQTLQTTVRQKELDLMRTTGLRNKDQLASEIRDELIDEVLRDTRYQRIDSILGRILANELHEM